MSTTPLTLSDQHRTVVLHVIELAPAHYTWKLVLEEHCGSADCDCTIDGQASYPSRIQAQAAAWAAGNLLLHGPRTAGECGGRA